MQTLKLTSEQGGRSSNGGNEDNELDHGDKQMGF